MGAPQGQAGPVGTLPQHLLTRAGTEHGEGWTCGTRVGVLTAPAKAGAKCWSELHSGSVSVPAGKKFQAAFGLWQLQMGQSEERLWLLPVAAAPGGAGDSTACASTEPVCV